MAEHATCQCHKCVGACESKPGWFAYGEAEAAAQLLGLPLPDFFGQHLGVDYWNGDEETEGHDVFVLAPSTDRMEAGGEYPANPHGRCVFLKDGQCSIHAAKPRECREMMHTDTKEILDSRKTAIRDSWRTPEAQAQIRGLLGREPQAKEFTMFDALFAGLL